MAKSKNDSLVEFAALNQEARRRGTSYGRLVAATSAAEQGEIIRKYINSKAARGKRKSEKAR